VAEPTEQQVTVMVNGKMHIFQFTDERLPPAAPLQISQLKEAETSTADRAAGNPFNGRPPLRGVGGRRIVLPAVPKRPLPVPAP